MTTYSYTVSFDDSEAIWIESVAQQAIKEFESNPANKGVQAPCFLKSIVKKIKGANTELMSQSHFESKSEGYCGND